MAGSRSTRVASMAGASPNSRAVAAETTAANANVVMSSSAFTSGRWLIGMRKRSARDVHPAHRIPSAPPATAIVRLSVKSWRTSRRRAAPSDSRIASSRRRDIARASSRTATFAQAINSTSTTITISSVSGWAYAPRSWSSPAPPASTPICGGCPRSSSGSASGAKRWKSASARACTARSSTPGFIRAITCAHQYPRTSRREGVSGGR